MILNMLKCKIHRATVTQAELSYMGSITIDMDLMDAAGLLEYEQVQVVDINNGNRLETYCIGGKRGSGVVCLNGAAARLVQVGDQIIIMAYCQLDSIEAKENRPFVVFVNQENKIEKRTRYEIQGAERLEDAVEG